MPSSTPTRPAGNPLWYKDAILYELHVRAFSDSNGDGIGDFAGLARKMDYLQDLGITAIWLLPFYPSPLKDDGYDTSNYVGVHPAYGTLKDFRAFLKEAHRRGLKVITELVLNHTSDQHPWFRRARHAKPGSAWRNFYVWSSDPERYKETRIIFQDTEHSNWTWDHVAGQYFWHRFFSHQPDLNWESAAVRKAMYQTLDFWLGDIGVDGLRLDAVPYLFEREGTNCENLPETHQALKDLRRHVDREHQDKMLLAEANQWPEDSVAYFGNGDECHTSFHFPLMPRMFMGIRTEDRYPIVDMLEQTPAIPENCQWVLFLRNHDELTLEMVTDEERDYMYRAYARDAQARINLGIRRRLAPLLGNSRPKIELMNGLLLSLPGTPVLYYGDEIGMGDNFYLGDRNGVRTPMQWSPDRNAGFSSANSQKLYFPVIIDPEYHYEALNVEVQENNPQSLLWWMKRILSLRKQYQAFGRGSFEFLYPENSKVLAYVRRHGEERIVVVANLSRFAQHVELNLSPFKGMTPVELFGRSPFPMIGEGAYPLTLGPHGFYWLALEATAVSAALGEGARAALPLVTWDGPLDEALDATALPLVEDVLPAVLQSRPWFSGRYRTVQRTEIMEVLPITDTSRLLLVHVEYTEGEAETYLLPVAWTSGKAAEDLAAQSPQSLLATVGREGAAAGLLYDAVWDRGFCEGLLAAMTRRTVRGFAGELDGWTIKEIRRTRTPTPGGATANLTVHDQTDTTVVFGNRFVMRLLRRLEEGLHPDLEVARFLTDRGFPHTPPLQGSLDYRHASGSLTIALLHGYVPREGDAWHLTLDELGRYFERVLSRAPGGALPGPPAAAGDLVDLALGDIPNEAREAIGPYLDSIALLGRRTAELHHALVADATDAAFAPETFSALYQRSLVQSVRNLTRQVLQHLRRKLRQLPEDARPDAQRLLSLEAELLRRLRALFEKRLSVSRMRHHGSFHLGQVLYTGRDFVIALSEGERLRSLSDRRIKRAAMRDVASMVRSIHYAAAHVFSTNASTGSVRKEDLPALAPWADYWRTWVAAAFLKSYLEVSGKASFVPASADELRTALTGFLLEKALHELSFELEGRLDWARIPLRGILELLGE
jgi:maltose alpha-D-glucosyltransferase / alpha-amylase